jgi:hypothetical protein
LTDAVGTASSGIITYTATVGTADLRKIIAPGSTIIITGFANADLNFDDGNNSGINTVGSLASTAKTRAIVASVPSASTFTIVSPVTITSTTVSGATAVLTQDAAVTNRPLDNGVYWLPTSANANAQIGLEWGAQMSRIQPNFADGVGGSDTNRSGTTKTITAAVASGVQIDFTSASHGLSAGQYIEVTGITNKAGASLDRVNTRYVISAVATNTVTVNSVVTGSLFATNAAAVVLTPINGTVTATSATFSTTAGTIAYTTSTPHGYVVGQTVSVSDAANENFSVKNAIITTNTSTTLTVQTQISPVTALSVSAATTNATYTVAGTHNFGAGDKVWIKNITIASGGATVATTSSEATILSVTPTSFTVATGAAGITATSGNTFTLGTGANYAQAFKGVNGSFSGTARVGQADGSWGQAFVIPSGTLITGQDNNELALTSPAPSGFPGYVPAYTYPNVVGAIQTSENPQAVRAFKAAGFTNVNAVEYTTNTAGASITQVVYNASTAVYTASSHGLVVGQTVTVPSVNQTTASGTATSAGVTYNSVITTTATHTFTVANASAAATITGIVGQWVAPKGVSISTITGNAAATSGVGVITVTTATPHGLKTNDLVGIAGATTDSNYRVAYVPGSSTLLGTTVTGVTSPTSFTYANSAACTATNPTVTGGLVVAYTGVAISQVLASNGSTVSPGATNTTPSVGIIVNATPAPNGTGGGTTQSSYY